VPSGAKAGKETTTPLLAHIEGNKPLAVPDEEPK
jgi:hypothetical protein